MVTPTSPRLRLQNFKKHCPSAKSNTTPRSKSLCDGSRLRARLRWAILREANLAKEKAMRTLIVLSVLLASVGCDKPASYIKPIEELGPYIKGKMADSYAEKGVNVNSLNLYPEKHDKFSGGGTVAWKGEEYKFTIDVTMTDGGYHWVVTPLTGNQELIRIIKYSTH